MCADDKVTVCACLSLCVRTGVCVSERWHVSVRARHAMSDLSKNHREIEAEAKT